ncbi:MAG TPA: hypothetical protein VFQ45_04415, partial [Longimicrobium sp.]|nr:hypothetical protein [Longimicrobium sp.]
VGYGTVPRENASELELLRAKAVRARFEASRSIGRATGLTFGLGLEREEMPSSASRSRVEFSVGLRRDF